MDAESEVELCSLDTQKTFLKTTQPLTSVRFLQSILTVAGTAAGVETWQSLTTIRASTGH